MSKTRIGKLRHYVLVEGDANLLANNEILVSKEEGYHILRKKSNTGKVETFVVIPLSNFKKKESEEEVKP